MGEHVPNAQQGELSELFGDRSSTANLQRMSRTDMDRAFRLAGLILGRADDAEDAVQEALARAWRSAGSLRSESSFTPWFDRILVNVCKDRMRRGRRIRFVQLGAGADVAGIDPFREVLDRNQAVAAMNALTADQRIVIVLHFWADMTLEAVADRTGWRLGTVKSRLHQGLRTMRKELAGWSGE